MGKQIKSKKRVRDYGEVFTPEFIVADINDLCEPDISDIEKRVFEPACGEGAFLKDVLRRKLKKCKSPFECLVAVSSIYGVDILGDNVCHCRWGLYDVLLGKFKELGVDKDLELNQTALFLITENIVLGDTINHPEGITFTMYQPIWETEDFGYAKITLSEMMRKEQNETTKS